MRKRKKPTGIDIARASAQSQRKAIAAMGTFIANRIRRKHPELRGWSEVTVNGTPAYGKCQRCGSGITSPHYTQGLRLFRRSRYVAKTVGFTIISGPEVCVQCMREEVERDALQGQPQREAGATSHEEGHRAGARERSTAR